VTGEEFLDTLHRTPLDQRAAAIAGMRTLAVLRSAVDLAGHSYADTMGAERCRRILREEWCAPRTREVQRRGR